MWTDDIKLSTTNEQIKITTLKHESEWLTAELTAHDSPYSMVLAVENYLPFEEIFITAPNLDDVRSCDALSQSIFLGVYTNHVDAPNGPQWMFTPPPMVFPVRYDSGWYGIGLGAKSGMYNFSGWSYRPTETRGTFNLEIYYEAYNRLSENMCTIFFSTEAYRTPYDVIEAYADLLRAEGMAPSPQREPANWWYEPMLCTWGDQVALSGLYMKGQNLQTDSHTTSMYETQANQMRWVEHLESKGIPIGLVSMSDKWQLYRYRLIPDEGKYPDLREFSDWHHAADRHVIAWWGLWEAEGAPTEWCLRDNNGKPIAIDPEHPDFVRQIQEDVHRLLSSTGYDIDGFFIDFTDRMPNKINLQKSGTLWGIELLHHYLKVIYDAAKNAKPDALIMTHCAHPYFSDVTDVLRINDFATVRPNIEDQARYRTGIANSVSDWLINTDNWPLFDKSQWRTYLELQPELGIPSSWYAKSFWGGYLDKPGGSQEYETFDSDDYARWAQVWTAYRQEKSLE